MGGRTAMTRGRVDVRERSGPTLIIVEMVMDQNEPVLTMALPWPALAAKVCVEQPDVTLADTALFG